MRTRVDDTSWYLVSGTDPRAARASDGHVGWFGGSREHLACGRVWVVFQLCRRGVFLKVCEGRRGILTSDGLILP